MHMVAARLGCQSAMVGTGWANSCPGCIDRLRKRYSHLVGGCRKGGTGGGGWGHPQGDMHMVAARLGCQSAMVGTGWANSCPGCMDRLRKRYSHLVGGCRKGETGGHPQGDMHMVAARLGCQSAMVGTWWANSCPGCMDRLRKCYSHLVGGSFLAGKVAWTLSGCMTTERVYDNREC